MRLIAPGENRGEKKMGKYLMVAEFLIPFSKERRKITVFSRERKKSLTIYSTYRCHPQDTCPLSNGCTIYGPYILDEEMDAICHTAMLPCKLVLVKREVLKKKGRRNLHLG